MEDFLKPLEKVTKVETPAFLYTRIQQRIRNKLDSRLAGRTVYSMAASFLILISLNVFAILKQDNTSSKDNNIASELGVSTDNYLYK